MSFVPIPDPENYVAHHVNHVRYDNRLENLMWASQKENMQFSYESGYRRFIDIKGENNPRSKLTNAQVCEIKDKIRKGEMLLSEIAKEYGICGAVISEIAHNNTWKDIGGYVNPESIRISTG